MPRSVSLTPRSSSSPCARAREAHRQQHEIDVHLELAAGDRLERHAAVLARRSSTLTPCSFATRPCSSPVKRCVETRVDALAALFVRGRHAEDVRPLRPRIVGGALVRRPRQQLELVHRRGALAVHRAEAVGAGVAAADDDDVLALGGDELVVGIVSPSQRLFCSVRYSIAKWMPFSSRPGTCRSRGRPAPPASTIASNSRLQLCDRRRRRRR